MSDKEVLKKIYAIWPKDGFKLPYAFYLNKRDAEDSLKNMNPIYNDQIDPNDYYISEIQFTENELETCNLSRVESVYLVIEQRPDEALIIYLYLSFDKAYGFYNKCLKSIPKGTHLSIERTLIYKYYNKKRCEFKEVVRNIYPKESLNKMDESKLYISSFVKDLNFNLAKILTLKSIIPDSGRVDYEFGTIEVTTDSPVIEFRFTLDDKEETEAEFKERCFEKMRDLLIQRTKGKL